MLSLDRAMGIKDPIARTKAGFQTDASSSASDWLMSDDHGFDCLIA